MVTRRLGDRDQGVSHPFGCETTQVEGRLRSGTVLVKNSSARGIVIRRLRKLVKAGQRVSGKKLKGTGWAHLP